jgi:peptide-methionine (S)-S-oxide reductase
MWRAPRSRHPPKAVFAGGCFWGVEAVFEHVRGVRDVRSGYAGGRAATAHYEQVGNGDTGHAEAVEVTYDPSKVSYGQLLKVFFAVAHDPTQFNRQGPDAGPQYRSAIFTANDEQARVAKAYIAQMTAAKTFGRAPIATQVAPLRAFYPAESYHQDFARLNPNHPYIVVHDARRSRACTIASPGFIGSRYVGACAPPVGASCAQITSGAARLECGHDGHPHHHASRRLAPAPARWRCAARRAADSARRFARAIVMPNLTPPVRNVDEAGAYRARILAALPAGAAFEPLMTLYLTESTTPADIDAAKASGFVHAGQVLPGRAPRPTRSPASPTWRVATRCSPPCRRPGCRCCCTAR